MTKNGLEFFYENHCKTSRKIAKLQKIMATRILFLNCIQRLKKLCFDKIADKFKWV